VLITPMWGRKV